MLGYEIDYYTKNTNLKDYFIEDLNLDESKIKSYPTAHAIAFWYKNYLFVVDVNDMEIKCMGGNIAQQNKVAVLYEDVLDEGTYVLELNQTPSYSQLFWMLNANYQTKVKTAIESNELEDDGGLIFQGCTNLENVYLSENLTTIGAKTFYSCSKLKKIVLPESITDIGKMAFYRCKQLQYINLPIKLTNIGDSAFQTCLELDNIGRLPNGISTINDGVFNGCVNLHNIELSDNVNSIGIASFYGIPIETFYIPKNVTSMGLNSFTGLSNLKKIYYGDTEESWNEITGLNGSNISRFATLYCFSETEPETTGNYWHYVNGKIEEW